MKAPPRPDRRPELHLHVRTVDGLPFDLAAALTGSRRALVQLRDQIDRELSKPNGNAVPVIWV